MFMKLATGVNNIKFFFSLAIIKQLITTYLEANKLVFASPTWSNICEKGQEPTQRGERAFKVL
jgi:hypothetical protein